MLRPKAGKKVTSCRFEGRSPEKKKSGQPRNIQILPNVVTPTGKREGDDPQRRSPARC